MQTQGAGDARAASAVATRFFLAGLATAELMTTYLGMRLGLYTALADAGPLTPGGLAERAGIAPRYAREWLEQQAVSGMVTVHDAGVTADERAYLLPAGHAEALTKPDSPYSVAPMALLPVGGVAAVLPDLLAAFRSGGGVPYASYGGDLRGGQGGLNQAVFRHHLAGWVRRALPDVHRRLAAGDGAVADVACGTGWSSIALAKAYPRSHVDGYDLDADSVADAQRNAKAEGVSDRVSFHVRDAADPELAGRYALVCLFDALHDMSRPVAVLRACRSLRGDGGAVLLMEPNAQEEFGAPAGEIERFLYAVSVLHCLPVGLAETPSAATGTVLRPSVLRGYAEEAGFTETRVLPVEHRFHRLYRLLG
jgi:2-polyprenyl-3-methyl-5-hydroxy-6-metoxy-1,4-benzoquinol methylase